MFTELFHATGQLARFILRRDRVRIPVWIASIVLTTLAVAIAFHGLYPEVQDRQILAETMRNPAITAMLGPAYGIDDYTVGAMMAHQMLLFTAVTVGIMSILLVTRHTRQDEESGRNELIRSLPVGRLAHITAAWIVTALVNVLLGASVGLSLYGLGIESMDLHGSLLYGAVLAGSGILFAALTALVAQLAETSRGTLGLAFSALIAAYLLRAVGDVSSEPLALASPLGLILRTQVYVNNTWWPVAVTFVAGLVVAGAALYLNSTRDLGAGLIPTRPGRKYASRFLLSPLGLVLRLQRTAIIGWAIGMYVLGASYGSVFGDIESFFSNSELMQQLLPMTEGHSLTEQFLSVIIAVLAMLSAIPAMLMVLKLKTEENAKRIEPLLASAVSRPSLAGTYLLTGIVVAVAMQVLTALGFWSMAITVMDEPFSLTDIIHAALAYVPAILVMVAIAALLIGSKPRYSSLGWLYLAYSFFVIYFGGLLRLPEWLKQLTPFGHVPQIPLEETKLLNLIILTFIAVILMAIGVRGYRQRDIHG